MSSKLKKVYKKAGYKAVFKSGPNLQTILTSKNKTRLPENSHPGIYKIHCKCNSVPPYIGETKLKIRTRFEDHKNYVLKEKWDQSGAALHQKNCHSGFEEVETIKIESKKFEREVREALEIQKHQSGPKDGKINQDDGKHVKTLFWIPMLRHLRGKEQHEMNTVDQRRNRRNQRINRRQMLEDDRNLENMPLDTPNTNLIDTTSSRTSFEATIQ